MLVPVDTGWGKHSPEKSWLNLLLLLRLVRVLEIQSSSLDLSGRVPESSEQDEEGKDSGKE